MMTDTEKTLRLFFISHRRMIIFSLCFFIVLFASFSAEAIALESYSDSDYHEACNIENINAKYSASACWSCDIIHLMADKMSRVVVAISAAPILLGETILLWGAALWLAVYFLKSVGAFAAQDPAKVLDGAFKFMFKVAFVYVLIHNLGFETIVDYIVNPILKIGMDIGITFMDVGGQI